VDDVYCIDAGYLNAKQRLGNADIGKENKALIENFSFALRREGAAKTTITGTCTIQLGWSRDFKN
jgi:hypothetical protein